MPHTYWFRSCTHLSAACALLVVLASGCGDEEQTPGTAEPPGAVPAAKSAPDDNAMAAIDVSFLVEPCVAGGIAAQACKCAGEAAKVMIGPELLAKMGKAPEVDDPALASYYSRVEIGRIMAWVDGGADKCGIEEEV